MDLHQPPVSQRTVNLQQGKTTLLAALVSLIQKFQKLTHDYFYRIRKWSDFMLLIAISQNMQMFGVSSFSRGSLESTASNGLCLELPFP